MGRTREHGVFSAKPRRLSLLQDTRGQGLVEYLLILVLVACGAVAAQQLLACQIGCAMEITAKHIENFMSGGKKIPPGQLKKCSKMCT
jgi:Flp pilus assembly pilin Flp